MSAALPAEAERHVVPGDIPETVRRLSAAVEKGEFGWSVVASFIRAAESGRDIRFAKTKPVPTRMREAIEAEPETPPRQVIYRGLEKGLWSWEDVEAFEANAEALSAARRRPEPRGVYLTRGRRTRRRPPDTGGQFVPKMALDAVCDHRICDGAKALLALILARAGKSDTLVTYTCSLAAQMGRTARTVRNHFRQLEEAGLIRREPGSHPNTVRITVLPACRPEPYVEPMDVKAFRIARRSPLPKVRALADATVLASWNAHRDLLAPEAPRKGISAFNLESNVDPATPDPGRARSPHIGPLSPPTTHSTLYRKPPPRRFERPVAGSLKASEGMLRRLSV